MEAKEKVDLSFLVGRQVYSLSLHRWGGVFNLDDIGEPINIGFDLELVFTGHNGEVTIINDLQERGADLLASLFFQKIEKIVSTSPEPDDLRYIDTQLVITFSNGATLEILNDAFVDIGDTMVFPHKQKIIRGEKISDITERK